MIGLGILLVYFFLTSRLEWESIGVFTINYADSEIAGFSILVSNISNTRDNVSSQTPEYLSRNPRPQYGFDSFEYFLIRK